MSSGRWQHLDRVRPGGDARGRRDGGTAGREDEQEEPQGVAPSPTPAPPHPLLTQATGYFRMRDYDRCRELLSSVDQDLPGCQRLLGLAAGHLRDYRTALPALTRALSEDPADPLLPLSLLSAQLDSGAAPEVPRERSGPLGEMAAAAQWRRAREMLRAGEALQAARGFAEASERFREASPPFARGERLAASYLGQVIAYLAADQLDAAQQSFSRIRTGGELPAGLLEFARQVYDLADATRTLFPAERAAALAPLVEMLLQIRLRVRFYDGTQPVAMYWEGLPV